MLPKAPYKNTTGAVLHSWMPEHWYPNSWMIGNQQVGSTGTTFNFSKGGFQGSIGQGGIGGEW